MINKDLNKYTKKEFLSGITIYPILKYLEELYGYKEMIQIVESIGLSISYLLNKSNWVSFDYYNLLLERLIEKTEDQEAPLKVYLNLDPQAIIKDYLSVIYPANLFISSDLDGKFLFNLMVHRWISKIGDYEILFSKKSSILIKILPKEGYKQNIYTCLSFKGFLIYLTKVLKLQSPEVKETGLFNFRKEHCIYKITWREKNKLIFLLPAIISVILFGTNILLYIKKVLKTDQFVFFSLLIIILLLIINKISNIIRDYKKNISSENKSRSIIDAIDQIEKDFNKRIIKEIELEEKNKYLMIINNLSKMINNEIYFNPILFEINKILITEFDFYKGVYYLYDSKQEKFILNFELDNKNIVGYNLQELDLSSVKISFDEYRDIKKLSFPISLKDLNKIIKIVPKKLLNILDRNQNDLVYSIPIEISEINFGFFLLFKSSRLNISIKTIDKLFYNIRELLRIGYKKISSRNIIENILSSIPASVVIFNVDNYQVQYINDIFISSLPKIQRNYTKNDIIGIDLFSLPYFTDQVKVNITKFIKKKPSEGDVEQHEINLGTNIIEYNLFLISQDRESGRLAGIIMNDITEAKYFQEHLFNNEKLIALGKVASGIAHEINNPLYAILADAEELADFKGIDEESKKLAEEIVELVMIVSNIIKDLSVYSKTLRKEDLVDVDLNTIIDESLKLVKYGSNFLEIDVYKELSKIPTIKATKGEMQQVFINLFNNAIDAMGGKGVLKISSEYKNNKILITVFDTGCGIKKDDQKHIFDLFFTTKEPGKGTGQGLHIVKRILNKYNANIKFNSEIDRGTKFYLTFQIK